MSRRFDEATRLVRREQGRYGRDIEEGDYWGLVTPHGGYLMALMLAAMQLEIGDRTRRPRLLSQHFLGRVAPGPIDINVSVEREKRGVTSLSARMLRSGELVGIATAIFTTDRDGPTFLDEPVPEVAGPGPSVETPETFIAAVHERFDFHRRFGADGVIVPVEDGGWIVPQEAGDWDHRLALLLSDLWIPPIIRHPERVAATPSLHHVVHFGPDVIGEAGTAFLVRHRLSSGGAGISDEDIALWSDDGRLLLRGRQLRMVVAPESIGLGVNGS